MSDAAIGLAAIGVLALVLALRMPVAVALLAVGGTGYAMVVGVDPLFAHLRKSSFYRFANYDFSIIPLFLLMGYLAVQARISADLYVAARALVGHIRGGLALATLGACAAFGAIAGSSVATAAAMCQVALPEMRKAGYDAALTTGTLAAGGTLGILIPPSIVLAVYGLLTESNIGTLFIAAIVPGLLAVLGYAIVVAVVVRRDPAAGPAGARAGPGEVLPALLRAWPMLLIALVVVVGIYGGFFTPTEAAAVATIITLVLALVRSQGRWRELVSSFHGAATMTGMIFLIVLGADLFNAFLAFTGLPMLLAETLAKTQWSPLWLLVAMLAMYLVLGTFMDSMAMVLLTLPMLLPTLKAMDFGLGPDATLIWIGILVLVAVEVGMISPPFGLNLFVLKAAAPEVPMRAIYRGVVPFIVSDLLRIALLVAFPSLSLALVRALGP